MRSCLTFQRYKFALFSLHILLSECTEHTHTHTCVCEQASEEPEERETLALMAARGESEETLDGETYIEKYTRGVLEVDNILCLERLRQVRLHFQLDVVLLAAGFMHLECLVCVYVFVQAVTVKEALSVKGRHIRRSLSTPNVQHVRPDLLSAHV